jgi:hypothetical protein
MVTQGDNPFDRLRVANSLKVEEETGLSCICTLAVALSLSKGTEESFILITVWY